jgi:protease-4
MKRYPLLTSILIVAFILVFFVGLSLITLNFWGKETIWGKKPKVGVVEVSGLITRARPTLKELRRLSDDDRIKAILVRINSPGGAVGPSQEIMQEILKVRKKKKVVASLGTIAASGGYYIACASDVVMANPGTAVGSIGVIMKLANVEQLTKKVGVDFYSLKAGDLKDMGSPFRPMSPEERAALQGLLDNIHQRFIQDVATNRKIPLEKMGPLANGSVFSGEEGKKLGLVDELGNFEDAVELAGRLGGITGKVEVAYPPKKRLSLLSFLIGRDFEEKLTSLSEFLSLYPEPAMLPPWFR